MLVLEDRSLAMLDDEFERFTSRLDIGEYRLEAFENDIRMHMNQELERRNQRLENTTQDRAMAILSSHYSLNGGIDEDTDQNLQARPHATINGRVNVVTHIKCSYTNSTLPLHRQIDVLLRLGTISSELRFLPIPQNVVPHHHAKIPRNSSLRTFSGCGLYYRLDKWEEPLKLIALHSLRSRLKKHNSNSWF